MTVLVIKHQACRILISYDSIHTKLLWKRRCLLLIGIGLLTISIFVVMFSSVGFDTENAISALYNENIDNTDTTKTLDQIIDNISPNGNQVGYQDFKNDIYYQLKTGSILNWLSISDIGDRINNILYDDDQKSIIIVLTPSQNKTGILEVNVPRNIIDAKIDERDKNFTVLVNDQPAKYQEIIEKNISNTLSPSIGSNTSSGKSTLDNDSRKLIIEFGKDARIIKIIGTNPNNISGQNQSGLDKILRQIIPILVNNKIHYTTIKLNGASLSDLQIESNSTNKILLLDIISYKKNGKLSIDLPRNIIDAKIDERDKNFTVLVNDQPAKYQEIIEKNISNTLSPSIGSNTSSGKSTLDNDSRKLIIEFGKDARIIKIIGTNPNNISGQNQSGLNGPKSTDVHDENQNSFFWVPIISLILGIPMIAAYLMHRKRKIKASK